MCIGFRCRTLLQLIDDITEELRASARLQLIDIVVLADFVNQFALIWFADGESRVESTRVVHMVLVGTVDLDSEEWQLQDLLDQRRLRIAAAIRTEEFGLCSDHAFATHALLDCAQAFPSEEGDGGALVVKLESRCAAVLSLRVQNEEVVARVRQNAVAD